MAELGITCPKASSTADVMGIDLEKRTLIRTGGPFEQNTVLDILDPGAGWVVSGDMVTFSGANELTKITQVYRNGVHQLTAESSSDDNDVYFVAASGSIGFEYTLQTNDILQFWKFNPTTSG